MILIAAVALGVIACLFGFSSNEDPIIKFIGKTDEYLSNLIAEINSIPICSERHVLALTVLTYIMDPLNSEYVRDTAMALPQVSEKFIPELLEQLPQSLRQEGLLSSKAQKSLDQIKIKLAYHEWKEVHREVKNLFKEIRPLDIQDVFRLKRKSDEAANLIKGQDIVLFVGPTGSGKTTTMHFVAGSEMRETTENGMYHIAPTKIKNPDLLDAATSASSVSQTRYISPVTVDLHDIDSSYNGDLILCDTPGMGDSAGPEVDIANGLGVINAIKGARSVKLVILISYKGTGNRQEGLRNQLNALSGIMEDLRSHLSTFSYFFTRYVDETERDSIHATLTNLRKNLKPEEESNENLVAILEDMIRKTEKGPIVIDPIRGKPGPILKKLQDSSPIFHPDQVFKFVLTQNSKFAIEAQVNKHQKSISNSLGRSDYQLAVYKLKELKQLSNMLEYEYINDVYNQSVRDVINHLQEEHKNIAVRLDQCSIQNNPKDYCDKLMEASLSYPRIYNRYLEVKSDL